MIRNNLQPKRTLCSVLFVLLLSVAGMTNALAQTQGALNGVFTINDNGDQIRFSQGNLQYKASNNTWRFAMNQYDYVGTDNVNISETYNGWIDLFGWGTSGYHNPYDNFNTQYPPYSSSTDAVNTNCNYYGYGPSTNMQDPNLTGTSAEYDWGVHNAITNGGNQAGLWRTLTKDEWNYIFRTREASTIGGTSNARFVMSQVNGINGIILFPDEYTHPSYLPAPLSINSASAAYSVNSFTDDGWTAMENLGCVFLPAAGCRYGTNINPSQGYGSGQTYGIYGLYWSSSYYSHSNAFHVAFKSGALYYCDYSISYFFGNSNNDIFRSYGRLGGYSVRLVCNAGISAYTIGVSANPAAGGSVTGTGTYAEGVTCTVTATANNGYTFSNWTENGTVVAITPSYSFTVASNRNLVANFTANTQNYTIFASANPSNGGTVTGTGTYAEGVTCTVNAIANNGYTFTNWTDNGVVVSSNASYSFVVSGHRSLVANFTASAQICTIIVSSNPSNGGTVTGAGNYSEGSLCTLTAAANDGYTFINWTENGAIVSTNAVYQFTVSGNRNLVAHFTNFANYWEPQTNVYEDNMTLTCVVQVDGIEQTSSMLELGAFCGTQCRGSQRATYFAPTNRYIIQMTIFGENNDVISFRLYDHQLGRELQYTQPTPITFTTNGYGSLFNPYVLNFTSMVAISAVTNPVGAGTITGTGNYAVGTVVTLTANAYAGYQFVNWTLNGVVVSTNASYQFTVTEATTVVANFLYVHTQVLNNGWNWWSTYIELNNNSGLSQLENSIGNAGIIIKSRANGYVEAYQYNGETSWYGTLNSINNEQMYKIRTNAACNATVVGTLAMPINHPISIKNGWNWIGFPCNQNVSVDVAMSGFMPENNDIIKSRNGFTTYYSDGYYNMWYGTLNTLEPGKGYMYCSNSAIQKTLVFQTGRGEATSENVSSENNIFQPSDGDFADNMTITAVLELDGEELRSDNYELAAFVGDECRGSVKLLYVESVNRYVAFLIVFGAPSETLHFRLTDGTQNELSMDEVIFTVDGMVGTLAEPKTLHFDMTQINENELSNVMVYPNPSNGMFNIQGQSIRKIEVFNAFGQVVVSEETSNDNVEIDLSRYADGYYLLRVITDNGITNGQLIKK